MTNVTSVIGNKMTAISLDGQSSEAQQLIEIFFSFLLHLYVQNSACFLPGLRAPCGEEVRINPVSTPHTPH